MFVVVQVRQALQHTATIGACSPYFALACTMRPCQTAFIEEDFTRLRGEWNRPRPCKREAQAAEHRQVRVKWRRYAAALYALPTWTRVADLIAEHPGLSDALGGTPSHWACYRFATKLRKERDRIAVCIDALAAKLREAHPNMGREVAIDASDMPAYANGQRYIYNGGPERRTYSDPDASWGHRSAVSTRKGGGFYGYRIHAAVCAVTTTARMASRDGPQPRIHARRLPPGRRERPWLLRRDGGDGHGLRQQPRLRRVRRTRRGGNHPSPPRPEGTRPTHPARQR
jgi:hypothetical protein